MTIFVTSLFFFIYLAWFLLYVYCKMRFGKKYICLIKKEFVSLQQNSENNFKTKKYIK